MEKDFEVLDLQHILRAKNAAADDLSAKASTLAPVPEGVLERRLRQATAWVANPSEGGETSTSKLAYNSPGHRRAGEDLQGVSVPHQADPHTGTDAANDPTLMALRCVGAEHRGAFPPRRRRVPIALCCHRQVYQVAGSNSSGQNQQAISSEVHQVHHMHIWGPKPDHHRQ
jgi:hypothetical protein